MEIGTQYYFAGCNGKPAGYCQYTETIGELHCFVMEDGSSVALGQEDMHTIVTMDQFHQMTLDEIQAMSRAISSICSACCKPHDTGRCSIVGSQVLCPDCMGDHLVDVARMALPVPQHTPEPWEVVLHNTPVPMYGRIDNSERIIAHVLSTPHDYNEEARANIHRIVECVNACAGQSIEVVNLATAHWLACLEWERLMMELVGEDGLGSVRTAIWQLKAERAELLAAAQKAMDECSDLIATPAGNALEAAIAKAKGGQS